MKNLIENIKIGDKVKITPTGKAYSVEIIVSKIVNKNIIKGNITTGENAGMTARGKLS